jgi:hypothetical protein
MSELTKRIIVALIGAPFAVGILWFGDAALATLVSIASPSPPGSCFASRVKAGYTPMAPLGIAMAAVLPLVRARAAARAHSRAVTVPVLVMLGTVLGRAVRARSDGAPAGRRRGHAVRRGLHGRPAEFRLRAALLRLRGGQAAGTVVVLVSVAGDVGHGCRRVLRGSLIGGRKLMPSISPGKTVSGAIGGVWWPCWWRGCIIARARADCAARAHAVGAGVRGRGAQRGGTGWRSGGIAAQARGAGEGLLARSFPDTAACSIASIRCCSRFPSRSCCFGGWSSPFPADSA